ncbi:hypothetical protein GGI07_004236 [Coemansia sp. Benny D115]|nr:hypothetical protein GGI07_004236 [Coemansia sp. Benny D115]
MHVPYETLAAECRESPHRPSKTAATIVVHPIYGQDVKIDGIPSIARSYRYDGVFGPKATQEDVYEKIVSPILNEVMQGYNCTIFAYGQTGTGKTYTMEGDLEFGPNGNVLGMIAGTPMISRTQMPVLASPNPLGTNKITSQAGVIPRTLYNLFYALDRQSAEYYVHVSYVELYNEELRDLLAGVEHGDEAGGARHFAGYEHTASHLKVYESGTDKGIIIQGLEEKSVTSAKEAVGLMQAGALRRKVAATKCNDSSSRSHAIFTITVYIRERAVTVDGEDIVKVGKLNLVDLAGSENIGRSGAQDMRAREAGNINKSLLVLGRVINALVERNSYVPYRDSKLTYILKDSLGGRTRTCMIATISDSVECIEETIKTLQYASQAKGIRNRPVANKKVSKSEIVLDMQHQIEQLKKDLEAAREKTGFYVTKESYDEMQLEVRTAREKSEEWKLRLEISETSLATLNTKYAQLEEQDKAIRHALAETEGALSLTKDDLSRTQTQLSGQKLLARAHAHHERGLDGAARRLHSTLSSAVSDTALLHQKIARLGDRERRNLRAVENIQQRVAAETAKAMGAVQSHSARAGEQTRVLLDTLRSRVGGEFEAAVAEQLRQHVDSLAAELETIAAEAGGRGSQTRQVCSKTLADFASLVELLDRKAREAAHACGEACTRFSASVGASLEQQSSAISEMSAAVLSVLEASRNEALVSQRESQAQITAIVDGLSAAAQALEQKHAAEIDELQNTIASMRARSHESDAGLLQSIETMLAERRSREAAALDELLLATRTRAADTASASDAMLAQSVAVGQRASQSAEQEARRLAQLHGDVETRVGNAVHQCSVQSSAISGLAADHGAALQGYADGMASSTTQGKADSAALVAGMQRDLDGLCELVGASSKRGAETSAAAMQRVSDVSAGAISAWRAARAELDELAQTQATELQGFATGLAHNIEAISGVVAHESSSAIGPTVSGGMTPPRRQYESVNQWSVTRDHEYILARLAELQHSSGVDEAEQQDLDWTGAVVVPEARSAACEFAEDGPNDSDDMQVAGAETPVSAASVQTLVAPETKSQRKRSSESMVSSASDAELPPPARRARTRTSRQTGSSVDMDAEDHPAHPEHEHEHAPVSEHQQGAADMELAQSAIPQPVATSRISAPRRTRRTRG